MTAVVDLHGWYWTSHGTLEECIVVRIGSDMVVLDGELMEVVAVDPDDVMVERPDPFDK